MILNVDKINVSFKSDKGIDHVLKDVSFSIDKNEIVGIVGSSGSGKTMTGLSIMGLLPKEAANKEGRVMFREEDIFSLREKELARIRGSKIAMIFQEPFTSLNPVLTVGRQIQEIFIFHDRMRKEEAKKESLRILKKVRIKDPERVFNEYPHKLSGGQRQRIMIAMAVALRPDVLIADEPTTALDVTVQKEILDLIVQLKNELKMSVVFITHDFAVVNYVADRILVMNRGGIVERGGREDILDSPKDEYTKKLISAIPKSDDLDNGKELKQDSMFLSAKGLNKTFITGSIFGTGKEAEIKAVKNVDIDIPQGFTVGLVGESGSGKSTLGRILLGLEKPESGNILIKDKPFNGANNKRIREMMQIVFQDPYSSLDPRIRMEDIVLEGPRILKKNREEQERILENVLHKVRIDREDRAKYPHQFSGGQRQRIAIARALAVKPEFLVLDEPVSSLDVLVQRDILELLRILKKEEAMTYLFISHDLRLVETICDTIHVMLSGEIVESGAKKDIYTDPVHPYTKKLLSSIPDFPISF